MKPNKTLFSERNIGEEKGEKGVGYTQEIDVVRQCNQLSSRAIIFSETVNTKGNCVNTAREYGQAQETTKTVKSLSN